MTCDEFKMCNANGVDGILALTRGERSAAAKHWTECFKCRDWSMTHVFPMTAVQAADVLRTQIDDWNDPETFKLDPAKLVQFDMDQVIKKRDTNANRK